METNRKLKELYTLWSEAIASVQEIIFNYGLGKIDCFYVEHYP